MSRSSSTCVVALCALLGVALMVIVDRERPVLVSSGPDAPPLEATAHPPDPLSPLQDAPRPRMEAWSDGPILEGTVHDRAGHPVHGAVVQQILDRDGIAAGGERTTTGSGGDFHLELEHAADATAPWILHVSHPDYVEARVSAPRGSRVTIVMSRLPELRGRVVFEGQVPQPAQAALEFRVATESGERRDLRTKTAADGTFALTGVPLGTLRRVVISGRELVDQAMAQTRTLRADAIEEFDLRVSRGVTVEGTVLRADTQEPVPGAAVWADAQRWEPESSSPTTTSDERGRYRLNCVSFERRTLDGSVVLSVFDLHASAPQLAKPDTVVFAAPFDESGVYVIDIELEATSAALEGQVLRPDGEPAPGARILCIDARGSIHRTRADDSGGFVIADMAAGHCSMLALGSGQLVGTEHARLETELESGPSTKTVVRLEHPANGAVEGIVVLSPGVDPLDVDASLALVLEANSAATEAQSQTVPVDASGAFSVSGLPPGRYLISMRTTGSAGCFLPRQRKVQVDDNGKAAAMRFVGGSCAVYSGRVAEGDHQLSDLELALTLRSDRSISLKKIALGPDGSFRITEVPEADYDLSLHERGSVIAVVPVGPASSEDVFLGPRK
jgi:hypothetical protein